MTLAANLVRRSRIAAGLSQVALGERAGIPQSSIARAEASAQDLTVATLDRLVSASGHRLTVLPTRGLTAADAADLIAEALGTDGSFRAVIQFNDDLAREHGAERVALSVGRPRLTGDARFDAFLAGVVETSLDEESLPHPRWLRDAPVLESLWFVAGDWLAGDFETIDSTPPALRARNVIIAAYDLKSL